MRKFLVIISVAILPFTSCQKDFLEVNSDSKYESNYVFSNKEEINRVLTAVYASLLSNDSYGNAYFNTFALNNDVEFTPNSQELPNINGEDFKSFAGASHAPSILRFWNKQYEGIERANIFLDGIKESPVYSLQDEDITQMIGEATVLRAMLYLDLVVMFGDIPFTLIPAMKLNNEFNIAIKDRNEILDYLIEDLKSASSGMKYAINLQDGVERASKEFCQGMIARIALTRGGYSLYPEGTSGVMKRMTDYRDYYQLALSYTDSVIRFAGHSLTKKYRDVFIDEVNNVVNNNDDPIFEIPFLRRSSGNIGYSTGSAVGSNQNTTPHIWGAVNGGMRLNAFYRFSFDREDVRKDYTIGYWSYTAQGEPNILSDYSHYNNKWSKIWADASKALGNESQGATGINFPYMRYADVLLMYAEAVNELENGVSGANGTAAKDALRQVRKRAFNPTEHADKVETYINSVAVSKESFFEAIVDERKWEFGGENVRWKDLVRWNLYAKKVYEAFMAYNAAASFVGGDQFEGTENYENLPISMFFRIVNNPGNKDIYPNTTLKTIEFFNLWERIGNHPGTGWTESTQFNWYDSNNFQPTNQVLYSFKGYIRGGASANWQTLNPNNLPAVRYILPIPNQVVLLSNGLYRNNYGYN